MREKGYVLPLYNTGEIHLFAKVSATRTCFYYCNRHLDSGKLADLAAFNVHLRGGRGYVDEKTGEYVTAYMRGDCSPAIDKGNPARPSAAESASGYAGNGRRVNIGAYGGTPWATMSKGGGSVYYIR